MTKAIFCDFYGTVVFDDDEPIRLIAEKIYQASTSANKIEIAAFWWKRFLALCNESFGSSFRTQRELELQSLAETLEKFHARINAEKLSEPQFAYWKNPPIFSDSKIFFSKCQLPIFIVSNIDTADIEAALDFHDLKPAGIITSEEAKAYKPRREVFDLALRKFGYKPEEVIHIGDSVASDVMGAKSAKIQPIWINRKNKIKPPEVNKYTANLIEILDIL